MGAIDMATEPGAQMVLGAIKDTGANDADRFRMTTVILKMASEAAHHGAPADRCAPPAAPHPKNPVSRLTGLDQESAGVGDERPVNLDPLM